MNDSKHNFLQNYKINKQVDLSYLSFFELSCTYSSSSSLSLLLLLLLLLNTFITSNISQLVHLYVQCK